MFQVVLAFHYFIRAKKTYIKFHLILGFCLTLHNLLGLIQKPAHTLSRWMHTFAGVVQMVIRFLIGRQLKPCKDLLWLNAT